MKDHKLYLLLSDTGSIISKGIKVYTRKPYSHISLALDINLNEIYSFGRLKPYNPLIGGFVREDIEKGTFSIFPNTTCELYEIEVTRDQYNLIRNEISRFIESDHKYSYNYLGAVGVMINKPVKREYSYFCSQFVAEVLQNSDIRLVEKDTGLTLPNDFRELDDLQLVYSGSLQQYKKKLLEFRSGLVK